MASAQGNLSISDAWCYRVFAGPSFTGNRTTLHLVKENATVAAMLAHSRTLPTVDNAYYLPTAHKNCYRVWVLSHHDEIMICGHALLAVAHHLRALTNCEELRLETSTFIHRAIWKEQRLWLELPALHGKVRELPSLKQALAEAGLRVNALLHFPWNVWVAVTDNADAVKTFDVADFSWDQLDAYNFGALILSVALENAAYGYRYFSPWFGKSEDSATGSAHCYLARYWLREGERTRARQLSPEGTAEMYVCLEENRVWLHGAVMNT